MASDDTPGNPFAPLESPSVMDRPLSWPGYAEDIPRFSRRLYGVPDDIEDLRGDLPKLGDWRVYNMRQGGMGEVYFCVPDKGAIIPVALKTFAAHLFFDATSRRAFTRECAIWVRLSHIVPGVWEGRRWEEIDGRPYMNMPVAPSGPNGEVNLRDLLSLEPLTPDLALFYTLEISRTMRHAAEVVPGLVHADLKPENILLDGGMPKVSDFGLARSLENAHNGQLLLGTPRYRAPEAENPKAELTAAADVYSFGVILREMLSGITEGKTVAELVSLADRCAVADLSARLPDFAAVEEEVRRTAPDEGVAVPEYATIGMQKMAIMGPIGMAFWRENRWRQMLHYGQYEAVISEVSDIPAGHRDAVAWTMNGAALSLLDRDEEAVECFDRALALQPDRKRRFLTRNERALSYKRLRRFREAAKEFSLLGAEAVDEEAEVMATGNLANTLIDSGRPTAGARVLRKLANRYPKNPKIWRDLAVAYSRTDEPEKVVSALEKAVALDPGNPQHYERLADSLLHSGRPVQAVDVFVKALALGSVDVDLIVRMGRLRHLGEPHLATKINRAINAAHLPDEVRCEVRLKTKLLNKFGPL
ncbi:protein kinase family protein [Streptomyces sp. NPDC086519]|uniref:protein kinase family protein n=1 Tax=Streptomyces sp. NPDC086519 TaxID=3154863 RepID=UPI003430CABC